MTSKLSSNLCELDSQCVSNAISYAFPWKIAWFFKRRNDCYWVQHIWCKINISYKQEKKKQQQQQMSAVVTCLTAKAKINTITHHSGFIYKYANTHQVHNSFGYRPEENWQEIIKHIHRLLSRKENVTKMPFLYCIEVKSSTRNYNTLIQNKFKPFQKWWTIKRKKPNNSKVKFGKRVQRAEPRFSEGRLPDTASKHLMKISMLRSHVASFK